MVHAEVAADSGSAAGPVGDDATGRRPATPTELAERLARTGYLADPGLATVAWLALSMDRPLMLEGEPGTGKTALAEALSVALGAELVRLQCYEGIDASQALYDWDFPRQVLHLRAVEASRAGDERLDVESVESSLFDERFLLARPILRALRSPNAVLLVDEVDRADDEFEAFLLEVLSTHAVTIPELGTVTAKSPPLVVLTSNRTREVHDALKRRCLYHWVDHPGLAREIEIIRTRLPQVPPRLAEQVATVVQRMRDGAAGQIGADLLKPPGVAESLDWARCLVELGQRDLDVETAAATLGAVCKYREDMDRVRESMDRLLGG
ncbi:MAG: AAA family ATPase [Kineosporiaceae bacterium]